MLMTLLAFAVTIVIIVAIHEYGHYLSMRAFGVRVLTFSVGFGPRLLAWRSKSGTDFILSAIPLGGYVKPLDRRDCEIQPGEEDQEFSGKPPWQRIVTYAAGPAANLVLAVFLYWIILMGGQTGMAPVVGEVAPDSAAASAGLQADDELLRVDAREVQTWEQFGMAMLGYVGDDRDVALTVRDAAGRDRQVALPVAAWARDPEQPLLAALGITPQALQARVGEVISGGAADRAGLQQGDRVIAVNGEPVATWGEWVQQVSQAPGELLQLDVQRSGRTIGIAMTPDAVEAEGQTLGRAGVMVGGLREIRYGPVEAIPAAFSRLGQQTSMILGAIGKMITGDLSVKTLGGPITIAQAAGETAAIGVLTFLMFLAFFSVSLGIINLLPIPMLDGGWIVFSLVEMIRGKALSERFLATAQGVGMMLVFGLMSIAIYNDLMRQFA